ncbi:MAG: ParB/RepB/Spo0J family partition protein [Planctomycetota bacterium]|nr:ParB/RepB/Spo0J family partition protein [Planctomycetota bacterium]
MIAKSVFAKTETKLIDVNDIGPNPRQPRAVFDERELTALVSSLKENDLLQPIGVRPAPEGSEREWELIWGERRLRAATQAGHKSIPARVCMVSASGALLMMGDENLNRSDWNAIEKAKYVTSLGEPEEQGGAGLNDTQIAKHYRKSRPWVSNLKRLLHLPDRWQQRIISGELSQNKANRILPYADQPEVLGRIEADIEANPWAWRTPEDFERNAKLLAENNQAETCPRKVSGLSAAHSQKAVAQGSKGRSDAAGETKSSADMVPQVEASEADPGAETLTNEERLTRVAETFPSLKGAPGVSPWNAEKLFHCIGPMSHGERLAALFCLHVWNPGKSPWEKKPFNLFEAVNVWDPQHLDALRAWLNRPFMV